MVSSRLSWLTTGSTDETPDIVQQYRKSVRFPVHFTTHPHGGFCPGRARNEGVAASRGEYVLLLDGDCMLPRDHVRVQLDRRRPGVVRVGDCIRLEPGPSASVSEQFAAHGRLARLASIAERARIKLRAAKSTFYNLRNHPDRPRLIANNVALWRRDYERVNGFDQSYVGWGAEDDDFGFRLRRAGCNSGPSCGGRPAITSGIREILPHPSAGQGETTTTIFAAGSTSSSAAMAW